MPNYDLGTAHGRIRIDSDTRGAKDADRVAGTFEKTIRSLERQMTQLNSTMNRMESDLQKVAQATSAVEKNTARADRSAANFGNTANRTSRSLRIMAADIAFVATNARQAYDALDRVIPPIITLSRVMNGFRSTDRNGIVGALTAIRRAGATGAVLGLLTNQLLGTSRAIRQLGTGQQNILRLARNLTIVGAVMNKLGSIDKISQPLSRAFSFITRDSERVVGTLRNLKNAFDQIPRGVVNAITGFALVRSGIKGLGDQFSWLGRIPKGVMLKIAGSIGVLPAAIEAAGKSLIGLSNLLVGTLDAAKQLSGGLLAIPGAIAVLGAAGGTLFTIFKGMKEQFKDVTAAGQKGKDAIAGLPPVLQALGKSIGDNVAIFRHLQDTIRGDFFQGFDKQLRQITANYLPALGNGMLRVAASMRNTKDSILQFMGEAQTISDVNRLFIATAGVINNINRAVKPVLEGFRDIGIVGAGFIRDLTAGAGGLAEKFAAWAKVNRENGNLLRWMQDGARGARDLIRGFADLTKAAWNILTLFKTNSGNNALDGFANSMEKFNKAVERSAATGFLADIRRAVQGLGTDSINKLVDIMGTLWDTIRAGIPFFRQMGQAASEVLVPALKLVANTLEFVMDALNSVGGGAAIGWILGLVGAWKILFAVLKPIGPIIKIITGGLLGLRGVTAVVGGLVFVLQAMGPAGEAAARGVSALGTAFSAMLGPIGLAIAAIAAIGLAVKSNNDNVNESNRVAQESVENLTKSYINLREAFTRDQGIRGPNVVDAMSDNITRLQDQLDKTAATMPGWVDHVGSWFETLFVNKDPSRESDDTNRAQKTAADAQKANEAIKRAMDNGKMSARDLANVLTGTNETFNTFIENLKKSGDGGNEAAAEIQKLRDQYNQLQADFAKVGTGGIQVAEGIKKIADAGADATSKLEGLKQVLEGLGLLQTTAYEKAFALSKAIDDIGEAATKAYSATQPLGAALDSTGNFLNTATQAGRNLFDALAPLSDAFLAAASSGQNTQDAFNRIVPELNKVADAYGISRDKLLEIAKTQFGINVEVTGAVLDASSKDKVTQDLNAIVLQLQKNANPTIEIKFQVQDAEAVKNLINQTLGGDFASANGQFLTIKPGLDQGAMDKLRGELAKRGIQLPGDAGTTPPAVPMPVAPAPAPALTDPGKPVEKPKKNGKYPSSAFVPGVQTPAQAPEPPPVPPVPTQPPQTQAQQNDLQAQTNAMANTAKTTLDAWVATKDQITKAAQETFTTIQDFMSKSAGAIEVVVSQQRNRGAAFSGDFAQGILDNKQAVIDAATQVAKEARDRMPGSPAKKGPLSGAGWSGNSGRAFSNDFATGIASGSSKVGLASAGVAGAASNGLNGANGGDSAGKFLGQLTQLVNFGSSLQGVFDKLSDVVFKTIKFISDPLGKGTFFGQSTASAFGFRRDPSISDDELRKRREDRLQSDLMQAAGGGGKRSPSMVSSVVLAPGASQDDVKRAIIAESQKRGFSREQTAAILATVRQESNFNPQANGGDQGIGGALGLFQQGNSYGPVENRYDPNKAIASFFDKISPSGGDIYSQIVGVQQHGSALAGNTTAGDAKYFGEISQWNQQMLGEVDRLWSSVQDNTKATISANPSAANGVGTYGLAPGTNTGGYGTGSSSVFPPWVMALAAQFGLKPSTYAGHQEGDRHEAGYAPNPEHLNRGIDWVGSVENMQKFADAMSRLPNVEQVIFRNLKTGQDTESVAGQARPGYFAGDLAGHADHVHTRQATPVVLTDANGSPVTGIGNDPNATDALTNRHGDDANRQPGPDLSNLSPDQLKAIQDNTGYSAKTQDQMLQALREGNGSLDAAINSAQNPTSTDQQVISGLSGIQAEIDRQNSANTPAGRQNASILEGIKSQAMGDRGISEAQNPVDTAATIAGSASSIAGDVFKVVNSVIESVGAVKNIGDTLVRGVANTEDVFRIIDDIQSFIKLAADVAGAVSSIAGAIGAVAGAAGGADPTGGASGVATAIQAVSQIAAIVQSALETVNAVIDLGQEAYRIIGSYAGEFLGFLAGGGSKLEGNVKFLLDQNDNTLKAYSADNPADKRSHTLPFQERGPEAQQQIGQVNVYGGPGSDPRDNTRDMMFAVKSAGMGAGGYQ